MNQSVCHHLITKKLPHWLYANIACFSTFYGWWSRTDDFCLFVNAPLNRKSRRNSQEEKCGDLFCLSALPHFASSNCPVITNLKNIADVRYDHASNVPQWAGLWSKRVRPCVIPCQKTPNMKLCLHVSGRRQKLSQRVWVRTGMCVIKPRYSAGLHSSTVDLEKLF